MGRFFYIFALLLDSQYDEDMFLRRIFLAVSIVAVFLVSFPVATSAAEEKISRQAQIDLLLQEVARLQTLLAKSEKPQELKFFPLEFERIYFVSGDKLRPWKKNTVRPVDQELFILLQSVIGSKVVEREIKEWRVFYEEDSGLGAFVESVPGSKRWVFGINRDLYGDKSLATRKLIAELFIHEYAHILFFPDKDLEKDFVRTFWTSEDKKHEKRVKNLKGETLFDELDDYFEDNGDRFVTEYATYSPAEDLAETFVAFVLEDQPKENHLRADKIRFFYDYDEYVEVREALRNNLQKMSML